MSDVELQTVVVLDVVEAGVVPEYCIHGRVTCAGDCGEWLWLGSKTHSLVASGEALPLCRPCITKAYTSDTRRIGHAHDHRRADGPHD